MWPFKKEKVNGAVSVADVEESKRKLQAAIDHHNAVEREKKDKIITLSEASNIASATMANLSAEEWAKLKKKLQTQ